MREPQLGLLGKILIAILAECLDAPLATLMIVIIRDANKDLTPKDQDKDKDLSPKDQDKDPTPKDQYKDKDLKYVLKEFLRTRTRTRTTARQILLSHINLSNVQW